MIGAAEGHYPMITFNSLASMLARIALTGALVGSALILQTGFVSAGTISCDVSWKNPGTSGQWTTDTNWNTNTLPDSTDNVCLPTSGTAYTVSVEGAGSANNLQVDSGATLQVKGTGGTATVTTAADLINNGGTVFIGQTSVHNVATIVVGGTFFNTGTFTTGNTFNHLDANVANQGGGIFTVAASSTLINGKTDSLLTNDGTMTVNGSFDILTNNTFTMNVGSSIAGTSTLHVAGGTVDHKGGTITGDLAAENVLLYPRSTNGVGTIRVVKQSNFLQSNVSANDTVIVEGGFAGFDGVLNSAESWINNGTIKLSSASTVAPLRTGIIDVNFAKTLTNNGTIQTIQGTGSATTPHRALWANLINAGTLKIDYDTDYSRTAALTQSTGTTTLTAQLDVTGTVADPRFVLNGGTVNGTGTLKGKLQNNGGTVAPGNSPGILTINGAFEQAAGGTLAIQLGGTTAGADNDRLHVTFPATLGGTLALSRLNGFSPGAAFSYDYLLYDVGATGTFSAVTGTDAGNGRTFVNTLGGPKATLTVTGGPSITRKPDGKIALGKITNPYAGDNVYNLDGTNQTKSRSIGAGKSATFFIKLQNDGTGASDRFTLKATGTSVTGYTFKCFKGTTNITTAVNNGTYLTGQIAVGAQVSVKCRIKVLSTAAHGSSVSRLLTITSNNASGAKDAVKMTVSRP
jgi:fibronectin-binding autotransporter adhesin